MAAAPQPSLLLRVLDLLPVSDESWLGRQVRALGGRTNNTMPPGGITFQAAERVLSLVGVGLTGESVQLRAARPQDVSPFTDSKIVYLPPFVAEYDEPERNFRLMKLMLVHQLTQIRNGSLELVNPFATFQDTELIADLYGLVEAARIERAIIADYRGLAVDLAAAQADAAAKRPPLARTTVRTQAVEALLRWSLSVPLPAGLPDKANQLVLDAVHVLDETMAGAPRATDSMRIATYLYQRIDRLGGFYKPIRPVHYRGRMRTELAAAVLEETRRRRKPFNPNQIQVETAPPAMAVRRSELTDDVDVTPSKVVVREQLRSTDVVGNESDEQTIWLDFAPKRAAAEVALNEAERAGAFIYDEWDAENNRYKPRWCALRERTVAPGPAEYVEGVLQKHRGLVANIKRQFDALRPEYRRLYKQQDGEDIDLDSVVEAYADRLAGATPGENLYIARHANRRDIGVAFLVDLSGSAGGWVRNTRIVDVERESLVLICEALQLLNDRYAIYGFSSSTRKQCDVFLVKDFGEAYNTDVRLRIGGLNTYSYTRMGPPIRHLTRKLDALDSRVKLLILLSDGKPNDFDGYSGRYAVEDTRQALNEARTRGIRTFCLTIDTRAREYLPQMFGENGYSILDDVEKLPARLPDLYRRLTTR